MAVGWFRGIGDWAVTRARGSAPLNDFSSVEERIAALNDFAEIVPVDFQERASSLRSALRAVPLVLSIVPSRVADDSRVRSFRNEVAESDHLGESGELTAATVADLAILRVAQVNKALLDEIVLKRGNSFEEMYLQAILSAAGQKKKEPNRESPIPGEIESACHTIRVFSNWARHPETKGGPLTIADARTVMSCLLRVLEWYCRVFLKQPRWPLYARAPDPRYLPRPPGALWPVSILLGLTGAIVACWVVNIGGLLPVSAALVATAVLAASLIAWFPAYRFFLEYPYSGTGRWGRWASFWIGMAIPPALSLLLLTSLYGGAPVDWTRYINPELRVGRSAPEKEIELNPRPYSDYFAPAQAALADRPGDWANPTSLTSWGNWAIDGICSRTDWDQGIETLVYESEPSSANHEPFDGSFIFRGQVSEGGEEVHVRLLDAVALVRRAESATGVRAPKPRYQQVEWWVEEGEGTQPPNPDQVVTKNEIKSLVRNQGDVVILIVRLQVIDKPKFSKKITQVAYSACLRRR